MPEEQSVSVQTSKKWTLNWRDVLRTTAVSLGSAIAAVVLQFIEAWANNPMGSAFNKVSFLLSIKVALATWVADAIRRWLKPSQTVITVKPPVKGLNDDEGVGGSGEIPNNPPPIKP